MDGMKESKSDGLNQSDELVKIHAEALLRFDNAQSFDYENRVLAEEDFAFVSGDGQWPDEIKEARQKKQRPCLTFNRLPQFIAQVIGDARQNKPAIKVSPVDSESDPDKAEIIEGLIRNIESDSSAPVAYLTALEHCCAGGWGSWRITTDYCDEMSFDQDIKIERIVNPFAVSWDPAATDVSRADAKWCFVSEWITTEEFDRRYPNENGEATDWTLDTVRRDFDSWLDQTQRVRLAEYFCIKETPITISLMPDGTTVEGEVEGAIKTRQSSKSVIERYVMSGDRVLEGPEIWAGKYIPVVTIYGPEEFVDGRIRFRSMIRHAKDAMRMYNYWQSSITEKIALAPRAPYTITKKQIEGLEGWWENANNLDTMYIPFNNDPSMPGPPQRTAPPAINAPEIHQANQSIDDIKATIGIHDASLGAQGNETSGKAILARQREGDTATFAWIDNLSRGIEHTGRILIDLIPKYYDADRVVRILGEDDSQKMVRLNEVVQNEETGAWEVLNDTSVGKYDVRVSVGPSYSTKRQEAADSMMSFMQAYPNAAPMIGDLIAKNMDWPGAEEIAKRLKATIPPEMLDEDLTPEEQEQQQQAMQQQQQQQQMEQAMAQEMFMLEKAKKEADIRAVEAKTEKDLAEAEAQEIENDAIETGVAELLQADG